MTDLSVQSTDQGNQARNKIRFVTAASLFDGHDASINIMRRILQASGVEVIHLGHNRSVDEVVNAAIQEDVQGIAISSYQGGHVEYFKYAIDLLRERGGEKIRVFGGGGGVIVPHEIEELHKYGVARIYTPEDGAKMGLQGMITDMIRTADRNLAAELPANLEEMFHGNARALARVITALGSVGLDASLADRRIDQLSGGQMRRVVLAGLLARSPRALILDEPLAGLDGATGAGGSARAETDLAGTSAEELLTIIDQEFGPTSR